MSNNTNTERQERIGRLERLIENEKSRIAAEIEKSDKLIEEYKIEIEKIRKEGLCPQCGKEIIPGTAFCCYCGFKFGQMSGDIVTCRNCGKILPKDAKFCLDCGTRVGSAGAANAAPSYTPYVPSYESSYSGAEDEQKAADEDYYADKNSYEDNDSYEEDDDEKTKIIGDYNGMSQFGAPRPEVKMQAPNKRICPSCGELVDEEFMFCDKCGTRMK